MKKKRKQVAVIVCVLIMLWSALGIVESVKTESVVETSVTQVIQDQKKARIEYHWDILGYEILMIAGAYGILGFTGNRYKKVYKKIRG